VKTSPLKLLFEDIYVRKITLLDANIKIFEEADGELNLLKIFPSSEEPEDSTTSDFPFKISVAELDIINLNFIFQSFDNRNSTAIYKNLNLDDVKISDLNLSLSAFADIKKNDFKVKIAKFNFRPNLENFELKNFDGNFLMTKDAAMIDDLNIKTNLSNLDLSAAISGVDFINNFTLEDLGKAPLRVDLNIDNFNFDDLSTFVESTSFLRNNLSGLLQVTGNLNNLSVNRLNLITGETNLICSAKLQNILDGENLFIDATLNNSVVTLYDVSNILQGLRIPAYNLGKIKFNELKYVGKPLEFASSISLESDKGKISGKTKFNFNSPEPKYDINIKTVNLDLSPIINLYTNLNSDISIIGEGFNPSTMSSSLQITLGNSRISSSELNSIELKTKIFDKILSFDLYMNSISTSASLNGKIDFIREDDPFFTLSASAENLNLAEILNDSSMSSRINTNLDLEGRGFDIDSMNLFLVMNVNESYINNLSLDSSRVILDIRRNDNGNKILNLVSNFADFTISGNYKLSSLIKTISSEIGLLSYQLTNKLSEPLGIEPPQIPLMLSNRSAVPNQIFRAKLLMDFKDFVPINLGNKNTIEIGGEIKGDFISEEKFVLLNIYSDIKYFKLIDGDALYFLTGSKLDLSLKQSTSAEDNYRTEFGSKINSERIYFGSNLFDFSSSIYFNSDSLNLSAKGFFDDLLQFNFESNHLISGNKINSTLNNVDLNFNGITLSSKDKILLSYSKGNFSLDKFDLNFADGSFNATGIFGVRSDGLIDFRISNLKSQSVLDKLFKLTPANKICSDINISGRVSGNFSNPQVSFTSDIENIIINNRSLGTIKSDISYSEKNLLINFNLIEKVADKFFEKLSVVGNIPIGKDKLINDSLKEDREINLKILADDLSLSSFGKIIPQAEIKSGFLESEIDIGGTLNRPSIVGYINMNDLVIKPAFNNLSYYINSNLFWENEVISIEKATITNEANLRFGGSIQAGGLIKLKELSIDSINIRAKGNLKLLDQITKEVNQFIYGDLAVETKSDILFTMNKEELNINLPLNIARADLVLPLSKSAYTNTSDIRYRYTSVSEKNGVEYLLDSLIQEYQNRRKPLTTETSSIKLNYIVDVGIINEAKVVVNLSRELNQDLVALLSGNINLISKDGIDQTSGQFNLLEGSKLSFIKTFEARGNVRFEKLENPLIDITATYRDYYYPVTETGTSTEQEVAVKIKLKGQLDELNQNFVKDPENIGVYIGTENILKEQRDDSKTPTDALFFIIAGKFTDGATLQERSTVASTATSFAGSIIGNVLNQYLGDYVRGVQLRQFGDQTKFSLIGRVANFRYEIGGTTEVFQDLSRANIKIELPIQQRLILRLERKESFTDQSNLNSSLYNEFGVKYKFEF
jgi:hypothetical protein